MERYWKLHGYPPNYKPNTWIKDDNVQSKANIVCIDQDSTNIGTKLTPG